MLNDTEKSHVSIDVCKARLDMAVLPSGAKLLILQDSCFHSFPFP